MRFLVIGLFSMLVACGAQDSGSPATGGEAAPAVSTDSGASGGSGAPGGSAAVEAEAPAAPEQPAMVTSCLSLVKQAEYRQAVDVCIAALKDSPGNQDVEAALTKAREETARMAAAEATGMAGESAPGAAAEATEGVPEMPKGLTP